MPVTNMQRVCRRLTFESAAVHFFCIVALPQYNFSGRSTIDCTEFMCTTDTQMILRLKVSSSLNAPPPCVCGQATTTADGREIVTAGRLRADIVSAVNTAGGRASSHELEVCGSAVGIVVTRSSCV